MLGIAFFHGPLARAGDPDLDRARALFEEAGELERLGNWASAQDRLRQALKLRDTPQLHYALGWALENEDKLLEAKVEYEITIKSGQNRSGGEEATRLATTRLVELEKKMPMIKVRVTGGTKGTARVIVDGKEVKREDDVATTAVNPGSHVIRVERSGTEESIEQMAYVGRSTVRTIDVDTGDAVTGRDNTQERHAPTPLRMTVAEAPSSGDSVLPWVFVASGAALFVGGVVVFAASTGDTSTRDEMQSNWCVATKCNQNRATIPETPDAVSFRQRSAEAADAGNLKQGLGLALAGVGLAAAGIGAYFFMTQKKNEPASPSVHASVTPLAGGAFASASVLF